MATTGKTKTETKEVAKPTGEMAELIEMAEAARDRRKTVSAAMRSQERRDCQRKKLVKQFIGDRALASEKGVDPEVEGIFVENNPQNIKKHAAGGAKPVLHNGQPVYTQGGDMLMERPFEYRKEELEDAARESKLRLENKSIFEDAGDMEEVRKSGFEEESKVISTGSASDS